MAHEIKEYDLVTWTEGGVTHGPHQVLRVRDRVYSLAGAQQIFFHNDLTLVKIATRIPAPVRTHDEIRACIAAGISVMATITYRDPE